MEAAVHFDKTLTNDRVENVVASLIEWATAQWLSLKVDLDQSRLMENVMSAHMDGITNPPIDELSRQELVLSTAWFFTLLQPCSSDQCLLLTARRRSYLNMLAPLVETHVHEKPLSIALARNQRRSCLRSKISSQPRNFLHHA
jgi:hypothetical protein